MGFGLGEGLAELDPVELGEGVAEALLLGLADTLLLGVAEALSVALGVGVAVALLVAVAVAVALAVGVALALGVALAVADWLALAEGDAELLDLAADDLVALGLGVLAEESETASRIIAVWPAGADRAAEVRAGG